MGRPHKSPAKLRHAYKKNLNICREIPSPSNFPPQAAEVGGGDVEEGGDVFEREEGKQIGVERKELVVALLGRLGIEVHKAVVDGGEDFVRGVADNLPEPGVGFHPGGYLRGGNAVYAARCGGDDGATRLLPVERKGKIAHEMAGELKAHHMRRAVVRIALILQRPRLHIAYPAPHSACGDELVAPLEMPQLAFPRAQLTPEISVDGIDI